MAKPPFVLVQEKKKEEAVEGKKESWVGGTCEERTLGRRRAWRMRIRGMPSALRDKFVNKQDVLQKGFFRSFDVICDNAASTPIFPRLIQRNLRYP